MAKRYRTLRSFDAGSIIKTTLHNSSVDSHRKKQKAIKNNERWKAVCRRLEAAGISEEWVDDAISYMDRYGYTLNQINTKVIPYLIPLIEDKDERIAAREAAKELKSSQKLQLECKAKLDATTAMDRISAHIQYLLADTPLNEIFNNKYEIIRISRYSILFTLLYSTLCTCLFWFIGVVVCGLLFFGTKYFDWGVLLLFVLGIPFFVVLYRYVRLYRFSINRKRTIVFYEQFLNSSDISNIKKHMQIKECRRLIRIHRSYLSKPVRDNFKRLERDLNGKKAPTNSNLSTIDNDAVST